MDYHIADMGIWQRAPVRHSRGATVRAARDESRDGSLGSLKPDSRQPPPELVNHLDTGLHPGRVCARPGRSPASAPSSGRSPRSRSSTFSWNRPPCPQYPVHFLPEVLEQRVHTPDPGRNSCRIQRPEVCRFQRPHLCNLGGPVTGQFTRHRYSLRRTTIEPGHFVARNRNS